MLRGYASSIKLDGDENAYPTIEPIRREQHGLSVLAHQFVYQVATDIAESASTVRQIKATSHVAFKGDVIRFTSGSNSGRESKVSSVSTDFINLVESITVSNTDAFEILRHKYPVVDSDGVIPVTASLVQTAIQYDLNGSDVEVHQDTGTPANSKPLPVQYLNPIGVRTEIATEATASDIAGSASSIDSKIDTLLIDTGSMDASLANIDTNMTLLEAKDFATQTTLAALLAAAATETTLAAASAKLPATLGQKAMSASFAVVLASDQASVPVAATQSGNWSVRAQDGSGNAITSETVQTTTQALHVKDVGLNIVDQLDSDVLSLASANIKGSGTALGSITAHVAALAANVKKIKCMSTVGEFIGVYNTTTLLAIVGPGQDDEIDVKIASGTAIKLRSMDTTDLADGKICLQFLG